MPPQGDDANPEEHPSSEVLTWVGTPGGSTLPGMMEGLVAVPIEGAESAKDHMRRRLAAAGEQVRTALELYRAAVEARNRLVFEAVDAVGLSHRDAARHAGISNQRLERVLAGG